MESEEKHKELDNKNASLEEDIKQNLIQT